MTKKFVTYKIHQVSVIKFVKVHKIGGAKMITVTKFVENWKQVKITLVAQRKNKVMLLLENVV